MMIKSQNTRAQTIVYKTVLVVYIAEGLIKGISNSARILTDSNYTKNAPQKK